MAEALRNFTDVIAFSQYCENTRDPKHQGNEWSIIPAALIASD